MKKIVGWVQGFIDVLNSLPDGVKETIVTVALIAAALGPVLVIIGKIITAVGTIMTIVPKVVGVIKELLINNYLQNIPSCAILSSNISNCIGGKNGYTC